MAPATATTLIVSTAPAVAVVPPTPLISGFTTIWGVTINPSVLMLLLSFAVIAWTVWRAQRSEYPFDLRDLVMINGKLDIARSAFFVAFVLSSWVIVDQEIKGRLTELIYGAYLGTWAISLIAVVIYGAKEMPKLPNLGRRDGGDQ